jgi:hypothetical protein
VVADIGGRRGAGRGTVERVGRSTRSVDGEAEEEGGPEPDPEPEPGSGSFVEARLGTVLQREARQAGHEHDWREYVAGRLLIPQGQSPPFGLLAESVPRDAGEAAAVAARWRVDPDLLWLVIKEARRAARARPGGRRC